MYTDVCTKRVDQAAGAGCEGMKNGPCSLYRHFCAEGRLLYVGISLSAFRRLGQHEKHSHWFDSVTDVTIKHFDTRVEALAAEKAAIKSENPLHNKRHKRTAEESRFERQERENEFQKSKERLVYRMVNVRPLHNLTQAGEVLNISSASVKKLIETDKIGAVITSRFTRNYKGNEAVATVYAVTGWQIIDYLEGLERVGKTQ